jgi:hypothetical protein
MEGREPERRGAEKKGRRAARQPFEVYEHSMSKDD